MQQNKVKVVCADFPKKALHDNVRIRTIAIRDATGPGPNLGPDAITVTRNDLKRREQKRMCLIQIGQVIKPYAAFVRSTDEGFKFFFAHTGCVGLAVATMNTSAEAESSEFESG